MRKVGVHLNDQVITVFQGPLESRHVGTAKAVFGKTGKEVNPRFRGCGFRHPLAGSIGGSVVNNENFKPVGEGKQLFYKLREIFPFIVRGDDDQGAFGHGR